MVKAPKLKKETVMDWSKEKIDWLRRKFRRVAIEILKEYNYANPKIGVNVRKYCEYLEISIDYNNENELTEDDLVEIIRTTNLVDAVNKVREIWKVVKKDIKKIYEWRDRQINNILQDKELEPLPELESPKILEEYLKRD